MTIPAEVVVTSSSELDASFEIGTGHGSISRLESAEAADGIEAIRSSATWGGATAAFDRDEVVGAGWALELQTTSSQGVVVYSVDYLYALRAPPTVAPSRLASVRSARPPARCARTPRRTRDLASATPAGEARRKAALT